eukprot:m.164246 g.164246  ORF g.164246 m.164246 type:complete len:607 (+) comp12399_c0_seq1:145-1965(+)
MGSDQRYQDTTGLPLSQKHRPHLHTHKNVEQTTPHQGARWCLGCHMTFRRQSTVILHETRDSRGSNVHLAVRSVTASLVRRRAPAGRCTAPTPADRQLLRAHRHGTVGENLDGPAGATASGATLGVASRKPVVRRGAHLRVAHASIRLDWRLGHHTAVAGLDQHESTSLTARNVVVGALAHGRVVVAATATRAKQGIAHAVVHREVAAPAELGHAGPDVAKDTVGARARSVKPPRVRPSRVAPGRVAVNDIPNTVEVLTLPSHHGSKRCRVGDVQPAFSTLRPRPCPCALWRTVTRLTAVTASTWAPHRVDPVTVRTTGPTTAVACTRAATTTAGVVAPATAKASRHASRGTTAACKPGRCTVHASFPRPRFTLEPGGWVGAATTPSAWGRGATAVPGARCINLAVARDGDATADHCHHTARSSVPWAGNHRAGYGNVAPLEDLDDLSTAGTERLINAVRVVWLLQWARGDDKVSLNGLDLQILVNTDVTSVLVVCALIHHNQVTGAKVRPHGGRVSVVLHADTETQAVGVLCRRLHEVGIRVDNSIGSTDFHVVVRCKHAQLGQVARHEGWRSHPWWRVGESGIDPKLCRCRRCVGPEVFKDPRA